MTKKDYELIALSLHQSYVCLNDDNAIERKYMENIVRHLSAQLAQDNPRFSIDKFYDAVFR